MTLACVRSVILSSDQRHQAMSLFENSSSGRILDLSLRKLRFAYRLFLTFKNTNFENNNFRGYELLIAK